MKNKKVINLEWYNKINKLIEEGEKLGDFAKLQLSEEENELFIIEFGDEFNYNWKEIEKVVFDEDPSIKISKSELPQGLVDFYEVDEQGNLTGNYDWDYIITIIETLIDSKEKLNIFEMWKSEDANEIEEIICLMPMYVACLLENINDPSEMYERLVCGSVSGKVILNCPMELRDNEEMMLAIFEESEWDGIDNCWDLLSDNLKQNKEFLARILELDEVKDNSSILLKIDPKLYQDDEEFKMKMLKCDWCYWFRNRWEETKDFWDLAMENIDDDEFFRSCDYIEDFHDLEWENKEFADKLFDEIEMRITHAKQVGKKINFPETDDEKIPLDYLRIMLLARDRRHLNIKENKCVLNADGRKLKLPEELLMYNFEIEDETEGVTIIYGTDEQGRQNIFYYYQSNIPGMYTRQQRILNDKGDVIAMYRLGAFDDGRIEDIDDLHIGYTYDSKGQKISSLVESWVTGTLYNKYEENKGIVTVTEIPTPLTEQDYQIIAKMKRAIGKTIGNTYNAEAEIQKLEDNEIEWEGDEIEWEDDEPDVE